MPSALAIDWSPIRDAAIGGVPLKRLAEQFNVSFHALKKRAQRHKWPIPALVRRLAEQHGTASISGDSRVAMSPSVSRQRDSAEIAAGTLSETLLTNGEIGSLQGSKLLLQLLRKATESTLKPLSDAQDVVTALKGVRLAAGMDRQDGPSVTVQIGGWQASVSAQGQDQGFVEVEDG